MTIGMMGGMVGGIATTAAKRECSSLSELSANPSIVTHLSLFWSNIEEPKALSAFKVALYGCTSGNLVSLTFRGVYSVTALTALAPVLEGMTGLQNLNLEDNGLGAEGVATLAPALKGMTGLQNLEP
jgi:hypothetical protein